MAQRQIREVGDDLLRKKSREVEVVDDKTKNKYKYYIKYRKVKWTSMTYTNHRLRRDCYFTSSGLFTRGCGTNGH